MLGEKIINSGELEFAVFCVENVAERICVNAEYIYQAFAEKSNILNEYIVPEYEVLHTQSKEYIVNDLLDVMKERGVQAFTSFQDIHIEKDFNMTANPILLQKKYRRVIECFANQQRLSLDEALGFFYHSEVYQLMRDGVSDMHCMSDMYLAEDLRQEYVGEV